MVRAVENGAVELYYDDSKKLETFANGIKLYDTQGDQIGEGFDGGFNFTSLVWVDNLRLGDSEKIELGASQDLEIYHNGSNSIIKDTGTGDLVLETTRLTIQDVNNNALMGRFTQDAGVELCYDGTVKLETRSGDVWIKDDLVLSDNDKIRIGTGYDLEIYHDGSHSYIDEVGTGSLYITTNGLIIRDHGSNENMIVASGDGAVDLYYDNSKKFATTSAGAEITGRLSINEGSQLVNETGLTVDSGGNTACFRATGNEGHNPIMVWNNHTSGTRQQIQFADGSSYTSRGSITTNGSNVTYGGTSDYRLKQDDVLITDGITKVKALKPKRFKWKNNLSIGICDGFFAHEVQETAPTSGAAIGTKDEVDSDGNPIYQTVDQAKLVPLLTAALQEAITKIETLETKVAALEGG
jgi:hypothetical protein